ncbi:MAG: CDP-alcohol phosphatidyltransferase family protein [Clostridia bacterium]|nr:CDP-alcohol phosphatidyltransferase family protein [Clostridia bacterium]
MLGFYNYTVLLTYASLVSAVVGIIISLTGKGHPFIGSFFLLFSGLCDAFDGKVARTKQNRSKTEMNYGIQIDSLSDLVAFGVLPACIGAAMFRRLSIEKGHVPHTYTVLLFAVLAVYVLAAMIRLAYYNVTEEERQKNDDGVRKNYTGLPVTSASLIFPTVLLIHYLLPADITPLYLAVMVFTAFLFLSKISIKKPGLRGILIMVAIGAVEFALLVVLNWIFCGRL